MEGELKYSVLESINNGSKKGKGKNHFLISVLSWWVYGATAWVEEDQGVKDFKGN